ncbi:hypothetical protein [Serratia sp. AKBS12]|uniref:hypothetical protein n=1 Tax=Serratia sp. AKBS12 TaxID=2974597 RepID=UPI0021653E7B|nr:hypothetical protein [Serratia sp. AKBS12]MCS3407889.1 hypothetical protein [Serratia sp. AKBS12]HEI8866417.1 hypothetical protein [Serratia odorifera]
MQRSIPLLLALLLTACSAGSGPPPPPTGDPTPHCNEASADAKCAPSVGPQTY